MSIENLALELYEKCDFPVIFMSMPEKSLFCNKSALSMLGLEDESLLTAGLLRELIDCGDTEDFFEKSDSFEVQKILVGESVVNVRGYKLENGGALVFDINADSMAPDERIRSLESEINSLSRENHDYRNQLHMLMGEKIQGGHATEIIKNNPKGIPSEVIRDIIAYIEKKFIAELLIGKLTKMYELGIKFNILPDSVCKELTEGIGYDKYITVIGNLLDNAVEELEQSKKSDGIIDFRIIANKKWTKISVTDNGRGTENEDLILNKDFSTKDGENRGLGLFVVKEIAEKYNGSVVVESYPGEGFGIDVTIFSIGE